MRTEVESTVCDKVDLMCEMVLSKFVEDVACTDLIDSMADEARDVTSESTVGVCVRCRYDRSLRVSVVRVDTILPVMVQMITFPLSGLLIILLLPRRGRL